MSHVLHFTHPLIPIRSQISTRLDATKRSGANWSPIRGRVPRPTPQPEWVSLHRWAIADVSVQICIPRRKPDRVLADPAPDDWVVPACAIVLQSRFGIQLATRIKVARRWVAEWISFAVGDGDEFSVAVVYVVLDVVSRVVYKIADGTLVICVVPQNAIGRGDRDRAILFGQDLVPSR